MLHFEEAQEITSNFVSQMKEISPSLIYDIGNPKEYDDCFYFDYIIKYSNGEVFTDEIESFGGSPGFIVYKESGKIEDIPFYKLHLLK